MTTDPSAAISGWTRSDWVALLARLTDGFVRSIPPGGSPAATRLPGPSRDPRVAAIEGFARMSVAWAAWLREPRNGPLTHAGRPVHAGALLARGLADATDPGHPAYWGPIGDRDQRIVEAAEVATALLLGGERLRAALAAVDPGALDRVLDWLALVDGRDVWPDNWVLFPMLAALARRDAGRSVPDRLIDDGLDRMTAWYAGDGWYSDGDGHALDLYTGWAVHWHLLWWATSADGRRRPRRRVDVVRRARAWLAGTAPIVAGDGSWPRFGRSLGYRFAFAAPWAQAALLGLDPLPPGVARRLASGVVRRAVEDGAVDPATDWFRVGVAGERPEVVEAYVSTGASAWAAHAFVALAMPETHPFWREPEGCLPADRGQPGRLAARKAGWLVTWDAAGATAIHNARSGHPPDIADHDYAATYGKRAYRSAFPADVPVVAAVMAGADDALVAVDASVADGAGSGRVLAHRRVTTAGVAGPRWTLSRYDLPTTPHPTRISTVVLVLDDLEIVVSLVAPRAPVRLRAGCAALALPDGGDLAADLDRAALVATVTDGRSVSAVGALHGFDTVGGSEAGHGRLNLVHERSVHPWVEEARPSDRRRVLVHAAVASSRPIHARALLGTVRATPHAEGRVDLGWAGGAGLVDVSPRAPDAVAVAGRVFRGRRVVVAVASDDGSELAGERLTAIDGVVALATPGAVELRRGRDSVAAVVETGLALDPAWTGRPLTRLWSCAGIAEPDGPLTLERPNIVPDALVRRLARRGATRLVTLRLEADP